MRLRFFNTYEPVVPLYKDLFPRLVAAGHEVEAVVASARYRNTEERVVSDGVRFRQVPTFGGKGATKLTYSTATALLTAVGGGADLNVFLTQPPLFQAWGRLLKRLRGQRYALIVMDLYPWVAIEAGWLRAEAMATRAMSRSATATLRGAHAVIVIGRCMAERVQALGVDPARIHFVPNWANTDVVRPVCASDNALRAEHGLADQRVVMYSGNLGVSHWFDDYLEAASRLADRADVTFLFVGDGARLPEVRQQVEQAGLQAVRFLPYQDYARLAESLSMGDVHFISLREGFEGLVVPSKTYGVLAAGRPIVYQGRRTAEIARLVEEHDVGTVVDQGDADGLEQALRRAVDDAPWREAAGGRARELVAGPAGMEAALSAYVEVLTS